MNKPILAHMNPKEIQELMQLQESILGTQPKFTAGGVPDFSDLEDVFANPDVSNYTMHHMRKNMANGGHAIRDDFGIMERSGRFGDTKMAVLPRSLADGLDRLMGGGSVNPVTGKREYFIPALLGGLASFLPSLLPSLGRMMPSFMPSLMGAGASTMGRAAMGMGTGFGQAAAGAGGPGGGLFSGIMNTLSNPNIGGALQNLGQISQLAAPIFGMFSGQQQQQSMPMQQGMPGGGFSGGYNSGYGRGGFGGNGYSAGYGGQQGYPDDVMADFGNPGNQPFMQSSSGMAPWQGMNVNGRRMNPSQFSNYDSMVPYRAQAYPGNSAVRYMR